jgi:hypothetical protein
LQQKLFTVNHEILLTKLHFYGIQGTATKWFRPYLTDRKQKIEVKSPKNNQNFFSNWGTIKQSSPRIDASNHAYNTG